MNCPKCKAADRLEAWHDSFLDGVVACRKCGWRSTVSEDAIRTFIIAEAIKTAPVFCGCDCGQEVKATGKRGTRKRFIDGHRETGSAEYQAVRRDTLREHGVKGLKQIYEG